MRRSTSIVLIVAILAIAAAGSTRVHAAEKLLAIHSAIEIDLPLEKIKLAIVRAGAMKGWEITEIVPGYLEGSVHVRSYVAVIDIRFESTHYTITYNRSENLDFKDGKINKRFNHWIQRLDRDIKAMLTYM